MVILLIISPQEEKAYGKEPDEKYGSIKKFTI